MSDDAGRSPRRLVRSTRLAAMVEQAAIAGGNLLSFLVFARHVDPASWGTFGLAYAMVLFAQGFQRALVTIPLVPYSAGAAPWVSSRASWQATNTTVALTSVAVLGAAAALGNLQGDSWVGTSAVMASLMLVPMFSHEFMRRSAIQEGRFDALVAAGVVYAGVVVLMALLMPWLPLRAWLPAVAVAIAAATAALVMVWCTRQWPLRRPRLWSPATDYRAFAGWAALSHLAFSGYNFGVQAVLAGIAGPATVGAFHACRILVQPINTLIGATDSVDKPRAASAYTAQGRAGLARVLTRSLTLMCLLAVPYLVGIALFAGPVLTLVLGEQYAGETTVLRAWCTVALCMLFVQPVESGLYVVRRTRPMFLGRLLASALALAAAVPLVRHGAAAGALTAMTIGFVIAGVCGLLVLLRLPAGSR